MFVREKLTATWHILEQLIIDAAIDQWRKRLTEKKQEICY